MALAEEEEEGRMEETLVQVLEENVNLSLRMEETRLGLAKERLNAEFDFGLS